MAGKLRIESADPIHLDRQNRSDLATTTENRRTEPADLDRPTDADQPSDPAEPPGKPPWENSSGTGRHTQNKKRAKKRKSAGPDTDRPTWLVGSADRFDWAFQAAHTQSGAQYCQSVLSHKTSRGEQPVFYRAPTGSGEINLNALAPKKMKTKFSPSPRRHALLGNGSITFNRL